MKNISMNNDHDVKSREDNYLSNLSKGIIMKPDDPLFPKIIMRNIPFMEHVFMQQNAEEALHTEQNPKKHQLQHKQ